MSSLARPLAPNLILLMMAGMIGCSKVTDPPPPTSAQWAQGSSGLPGAGLCACLTASGTMLLAGTDGAGVFRSTDGGVSWTAATTQPTSLAIRALTASGTTLLAGTDGAGVFRSTDGGVSWTAATT